MAGRRMKLKMDMPVFSTIPVDRKVIASWQGAIPAIDRLDAALAGAWHEVCKNDLRIQWNDHRVAGSIAEVSSMLCRLQPLGLRLLAGNEFEINGTRQDRISTVQVQDVAQVDIDLGVWALMILNTYRTMIQQLTGPMIGFNFNITIAGVVATCLRLGVDIDFEAG